MIRQFLTDQLGQLDDHEDDIVPLLRAMRAPFRGFLAVTEALQEQTGGGLSPGVNGTPGWMFNDVLGELRAIFGIHIAHLSTKFGIDIEDDRASILP